MMGRRFVARRAAWRLVGGSVARTARLVANGRLSSPSTLLGRRLPVGDGDSSIVFRETVLDGGIATDPAVLVVRFRLRWAGRSPLVHAIFRTTCVVNTPLFAGFKGFASKLWMVDPASDVYRGLYEWDGATSAEEYAEALCRVLALVCVTGSVRYRIYPGVHRDDVVHQTRSGGSGGGVW